MLSISLTMVLTKIYILYLTLLLFILCFTEVQQVVVSWHVGVNINSYF